MAAAADAAGPFRAFFSFGPCCGGKPAAAAGIPAAAAGFATGSSVDLPAGVAAPAWAAAAAAVGCRLPPSAAALVAMGPALAAPGLPSRLRLSAARSRSAGLASDIQLRHVSRADVDASASGLLPWQNIACLSNMHLCADSVIPAASRKRLQSRPFTANRWRKLVTMRQPVQFYPTLSTRLPDTGGKDRSGHGGVHLHDCPQSRASMPAA